MLYTCIIIQYIQYVVTGYFSYASGMALGTSGCNWLDVQVAQLFGNYLNNYWIDFHALSSDIHGQ